MSKSRGNVVNPQEFVDRYGSDALRCFLMFIGPWNQGGPWDGRGIEGVSRFLRRALSLVAEGEATGAEADPTELDRRTNQMVKKVTEDLEAFRFNTGGRSPHGADELPAGGQRPGRGREVGGGVAEVRARARATSRRITRRRYGPAIGEDYSVHEQEWPGYDESLIKTEEITLVSSGQRQAPRPHPGARGYCGRYREGARVVERKGPASRRGQGNPQGRLCAGTAGQRGGRLARISGRRAGLRSPVRAGLPPHLHPGRRARAPRFRSP